MTPSSNATVRKFEKAANNGMHSDGNFATLHCRR